MNKKLLLLISLLTAVLLVVACGSTQPDVTASAQSVAVSPQETSAPVQATNEVTAQPTEETQPSDSANNAFPDPQPASTNTVIAAAQTWDDAEDVMRSGRILGESPVYESPNADAMIVGEYETGALVIVTRSLDDWYEIIYNDGATRHAWLPQSAITFDALSVAPQDSDATTVVSTVDPMPASKQIPNLL